MPEERFFAQLPPVLVALAAVALIFLVNADAPPPAATQPAAVGETHRPLRPALDTAPAAGKPARQAATGRGGAAAPAA